MRHISIHYSKFFFPQVGDEIIFPKVTETQCREVQILTARAIEEVMALGGNKVKISKMEVADKYFAIEGNEFYFPLHWLHPS